MSAAKCCSNFEMEFVSDESYFDVEFTSNDLNILANFGEIQGYVGETDPTVPDWAKQPTKPVYSIEEIIGAVGRGVAGKTFIPYTVDEPNNYAYIYDDPVIAAEGAEIYNDYNNNIATGFMAVARGYQSQAIGNYSVAEGWWTRADGQCAIASGLLSIASGHFTHAEGTRTKATVNNAHSEGDSTTASGRQSHAEGNGTTASGFCSHAEGRDTVASNYESHAEGLGTIASGRNQTVVGKYNVADTGKLFIVGNGTGKTKRSNAFTVDTNGNGKFIGYAEATHVVLKSPNGTRFKLTVDDNGALITTQL